jgi:hypothetical protein
MRGGIGFFSSRNMASPEVAEDVAVWAAREQPAVNNNSVAKRIHLIVHFAGGILDSQTAEDRVSQSLPRTKH